MAEQTTYTSSLAQASVSPKLLHAGVTPIVGKFVYTPDVAATYTASCVVHLAKIPNKATLLDGYVIGEGDGMSTGYSVYLNTTLLSAAALDGDTVIARLTKNLPIEVSASASDGNNEYWNISVRNLNTYTTTETLAFVFYVCKDGLTNTGRG